MASVLLILQFVLAIILTIIVLLQKSSSIGLGAYSGSNESVFGAKGPAGFLTKLTFSLAIVFVINTLLLGYLYNTAKKTSIAEAMKKEKIIPQKPVLPKAQQVPAVPSAPTVPTEKK